MADIDQTWIKGFFPFRFRPWPGSRCGDREKALCSDLRILDLRMSSTLFDSFSIHVLTRANGSWAADFLLFSRPGGLPFFRML
jgi:hypothetical protein